MSYIEPPGWTLQRRRSKQARAFHAQGSEPHALRGAGGGRRGGARRGEAASGRVRKAEKWWGGSAPDPCGAINLSLSSRCPFPFPPSLPARDTRSAGAGRLWRQVSASLGRRKRPGKGPPPVSSTRTALRAWQRLVLLPLARLAGRE